MALVPFGPARRVAVICDRCGPAWTSNLTTDVDPTFTDTATAYRLLARLGWFLAADHMTCGACTQLAECEQHGHVWAHDLHGSREVGLKGEPLPGHRYCRRCGTNVPLAVAAGTAHPDRAADPLTSEEQAVLVDLELDMREGE